MSTPVVGAIVAASAAVLVGLINLWSSRAQGMRLSALEERKAELSERGSARQAKVDYEYQARLRLYGQWEPALFQLLERSRYALNRIENLGNPDVWKQLAESEPDPAAKGRAVMPAAKYEVIATMYGLYSPLVVIREMSRRLTLFDLSLEPKIQLQYLLATAIYNTVQDDLALAAIEPVILYTPFADDWRSQREVTPRQYWWQGVTMGRLENLLDLMTVTNLDGSSRLASFGQFERVYFDSLADPTEDRRKTIAAGANPLYRFQPADRPVFCRILIVQARLYQALGRTRRPDFSVPSTAEAWAELLHLTGEFFTSPENDPAGVPMQELLTASDDYLQGHVTNAWAAVGG
jgi:hypothetical protein